MEKHKPGKIPLVLLVVVVDRDIRKKVVQMMESHKSYFNLVMHGKGTAHSQILNYLGLGEAEKEVFFSIRAEERAYELMDALDEKLEFVRPGHGMAFIADIRHGCYHKPVRIAQLEGDSEMETENHELIMAVVNRGYTDDVMEAARGAGANGGTVLHARGCGLSGAEKFFGVTIQPEKEVIMIVAHDNNTCDIMDAIAEKCGPETDAGAISFAMPVSHVRGVSDDVPDSIK